ncbi:MAG: hypothetical protein ACOYIP_04105 [Coriobacteriales bacterium]|jgi:hypothetical protein
MYHELTYEEIARRRRRNAIIAGVCAVLCAIAILLAIASARISDEQAAQSLHDSVTSAAMQCAAVEGSYPSSLSYLEEHYGVTINHDRYIVDYEWFADNVPPTVKVRQR